MLLGSGLLGRSRLGFGGGGLLAAGFGGLRPGGFWRRQLVLNDLRHVLVHVLAIGFLLLLGQLFVALRTRNNKRREYRDTSQWLICQQQQKRCKKKKEKEKRETVTLPPSHAREVP